MGGHIPNSVPPSRRLVSISLDLLPFSFILCCSNSVTRVAALHEILLEEDPEEITIDTWELWTVNLMREVYVGEVLLQFDGNSRFAYVRGLCKVRHARGRGVRVSVTERYIVVEVSWRSLRSLLKQVFCSSSRCFARLAVDI